MKNNVRGIWGTNVLALVPEIKELFNLKPPGDFAPREMVQKAWMAGKTRVIISAHIMAPVRIKSRNLA